MSKNILIVDDSAAERMILSNLLSKEYNVIFAGTGSELNKVLCEQAGTISAIFLDLIMLGMDGYEVLRAIRTNAVYRRIPVIVITALQDEESQVKAMSLGANGYVFKPYNQKLIKYTLENAITLRETSGIINTFRRDSLTGLYNRAYFFELAEAKIKQSKADYYMLSCIDIENFKVINDQYGTNIGDEILKHIADSVSKCLQKIDGVCCRYTADKFGVLYPAKYKDLEIIKNAHKTMITTKRLGNAIKIRIGRYLVDDITVPISAMYDRATLAEESIRGRYDNYIAEYDASMRTQLLSQQKIVNDMHTALSNGEFFPLLQPQYNHATGAIIGAEALVRWKKEDQYISPADFIPIFERNGFIYEMDQYIWEEICKLLRCQLDRGVNPLPLSVNISRRDLFHKHFIQVLTGIVQKYNIPYRLLRLEVTESAFAESSGQIIAKVNELIKLGFTVEIDDFGSGYSSLNTLKDVPASILKLDMKFFENTKNTQRGGNIIESVVRMAKWLGMAVIAEGVEEKEQADYLKSIGCYYIQGYYYARPMSIAEYEELLLKSRREQKLTRLQTLDNLNNNEFWNSKSMDTLLFNSYVGAACILEFFGGRIEMLRASDLFVKILGSTTMKLHDLLQLSWTNYMDSKAVCSFNDAIKKSMEAGEAVTLVVEFSELPGCPRKTYLRTSLRVIATTGDRSLIYCLSENITAQKQAEQKQLESAQQLKLIMNNVNSGIVATLFHDKNNVEILFYNDAFYEMYGYTREQMTAEQPNVLDIILEEDREKTMDTVARIVEMRGSETYEYRCRKRDGSIVWIRCTNTVISLGGFKDMVLLAVTNDITVEKESEAQLTFLNNSAHDILEQPDSNQAIDKTLENLLHYFNAERAYVIEFDYENNVSNNTYEKCADGVTSEIDNLKNIPLSVSKSWYEILRKNEFVVIHNVESMDESEGELKTILLRQNIHSLILTPLWKSGSLAGYSGIDNPRKALNQLDRLKALADYMSILILHRDLNAKILHDANAIKTMMDDVPGGFMRLEIYADKNPTIENVNDGLCRMLNMTRDEVMKEYGNDAYRCLSMEDIARENDGLIFNFDACGQFSSKCRMRGKDEKIIWVLMFGRFVHDRNGRLFLNCYFTDITEQEEKNSQLTLLTGAIPGGIASYSIECDTIRLLYCNEGYCAFSGYSRDEYMQYAQKDPYVLAIDEDRPKLHAFIQKIIDEKENSVINECIFRGKTKTEQVKWFSVRASVYMQDDKRAVLNIVQLDVTAQQEEKERLHISETVNRLAMEHSGNIITRLDVAKRTLTLPNNLKDIYGLPHVLQNMPEEQIALGRVSSDTADVYTRMFEEIYNGTPSGEAVYKQNSSIGWRWLEAKYTTIFSNTKKPVSAVITFADITEMLEKEVIYNKWQQALEERGSETYTLYRYNLNQDEVYDTVEGDLLDVINIIDGLQSFNERTKAFANKIVFAEDQKKYLNFVNPDTLLANYYRGKRTAFIDFRGKIISGEIHWLRLSVELVEYPNSTDVQAYFLYEDIHESKLSELSILEKAETDPLTGVLNRATFEQRMNEIINNSKSDEVHALLMLDVDGFKLVNDVFGHGTGDQTLINIARLLSKAIRKEDLVGRLGGDEFVVFLCDIPDEALAVKKAKQICELAKKKLSVKVQISGSIGISIYPQDGESFEVLYRKADKALYNVKESGKDNFALSHNMPSSKYKTVKKGK